MQDQEEVGVDDDQVRELYEGCYARLVGQVFLLTGDQAAAQDAVQEAFTRALTRRGAFARVEEPEAWLRVVAFNVARSRWRRLRHLDRLLGVGQAPRPGEPQQQAELSPDRVALVAALRELPPEQREALTLHHVADLPVSEVAALVQAPVGTVKARLSRGRARLAVLLRDDLDDADDLGTEASRG